MKTRKNKRTLSIEKIKITKLENPQYVRGGSIPPTKKTDFRKCGPITKTLPIGPDPYI
ncbi:hypothetical protein [Aquimarina algiphila]|uniref:hypothetical protein n=1 Tax=Aquimarina algiphila TaxID=2047982 RepID=UPI002493B5CC|nr:hypothetical protein [Aquimarina algiphila]